MRLLGGRGFGNALRLGVVVFCWNASAEGTVSGARRPPKWTQTGRRAVLRDRQAKRRQMRLVSPRVNVESI